ncbi:MAG: hypothetical protein QOH88_3349 [Verrucomicrobiota bacterium]|jgi:hypothetical protein
MFRRVLALVTFLLSLSLVPASADTFLVTNTNDSGAGSLRQAITAANAHPNSAGVDVIAFNVPGPGVHTIVLASALPDLIEGVKIDGWSQPGFQAAPLIELSGSPGLAADGLRVMADGTIIRGLVINGFQAGIRAGPQKGNIIEGCYIGTDKSGTLSAPNDYGIVLNQPANTVIGGARNIISGNRHEAILVTQFDPNSSQPPTLTIKGNYIGTDVSGALALPNSHDPFSAFAVSVSCRYALIGGTTAGEGNLISGNAQSALGVSGIGSQVQGNLVGTTASGAAALRNGGAGIVLGRTGPSEYGPTVGGTIPGARNVISGNSDGIVLQANGATIQGNFIGTDVSGKIGIGNTNKGIAIVGASFNVIGGAVPGAGNLISGNDLGMSFSHVNYWPPETFITDSTATYNIIQGNLIGTDITGMTAIPNRFGISFTRSGGRYGFENAAGNTIGGTRASTRNLISGNSFDGIFVEGNTFPLLIQRNFIGVAADGINALGNKWNGIEMSGNEGTTIGAADGANIDAANTIAFNGGGSGSTAGRGIYLASNGGLPLSHRISANSIHDNLDLGVDLGATGVTPNTSNSAFNFPVINGAFSHNGQLTIYGTLNSVASTNFTLEFFASQAADPSGFGEGQVFLGQANVTTDSAGNVAFNVTFPLPPNVTVVAATKIAPLSRFDAPHATSEFSAAANIVSSAPTTPPTSPTPVVLPSRADQLLNLSARVHVGIGDNVLIGGFIISGTEAKKVIIRGLGPSLAESKVPGFLANPVLELYDSGGQALARNDDWKQDQQTEIENTGLAPAHNEESAIVRTLAPGNYTAMVRGQGGGTGIGLIELYDLAPGSDSHVVNVSTRGIVLTGDDVMIGGFIVGGSGGGTTSVVVRAIGPSLASFGVPNPLADPTLVVRTANGTIVGQNDNWAEGSATSSGPDFANGYQRSRVVATALAPTHDLESAVVAELGPGNYTAVVQGKNGATGIGLVEIYNLR